MITWKLPGYDLVTDKGGSNPGEGGENVFSERGGAN